MKNIFTLVLLFSLMSCSSDNNGDEIYSTPCDECPIIMSVNGPHFSFSGTTGEFTYYVEIENCDGSDKNIVITNGWDGTYEDSNPIDNNPPLVGSLLVDSEYCN